LLLLLLLLPLVGLLADAGACSRRLRPGEGVSGREETPREEELPAIRNFIFQISEFQFANSFGVKELSKKVREGGNEDDASAAEWCAGVGLGRVRSRQLLIRALRSPPTAGTALSRVVFSALVMADVLFRAEQLPLHSTHPTSH